MRYVILQGVTTTYGTGLGLFEGKDGEIEMF
jgi:hypothetical protein